MFPALQLAHLSGIVNDQKSNDHAKILVEVAWVLSFLTGELTKQFQQWLMWTC